MGTASSKFRKHLQSGDEVQALQLYRTNSELRKALDPNCSYGDSHQHETPLHLVAKHGMQTLLGIFLFSKGGNPNKTNARKETCLHCVCMEINSQSIHVCKRRAECLNYLLKWRGATLAEGQVERVDLAAQDEKLNTALHYAAASGLTQCVEILIQHGAPLFVENEDSLTPCDTAERNGHAGIALYLESKMVFSNDEELHGEEDNVSMPPVEEYSGLRPQDLQEAKDQLLVETADMLSVPLFTAEALLRNHEWSREMLLEAWMSDPVACCEKCGVTPPSTLFSEKPQVQENLASPLPSPLHATPTPLDAECDICANTFLIADEPVLMTCTHRFCKDCWERYLNVKIQEGDAHHITCPAYECTMLVPVDIIERIVSRDMALRYLQFDIKAFVDSNPDMKWCPSPGCGRAVKLPDLDLGVGPGNKRTKIPSDTSRGVDCGVGHYFCWECLEEAHEPSSCENWIKWFHKISNIRPETLAGTEQETELAANCLWLVTNSKPCPNCKSPIQKNEGCNHMKCSKCKFDFCWVCLEQWKRHNSSTGGYFKCNRYEVLKKVEEQSAQLVSEAETKNKSMQELNRFVHYYTRFKNHENSFKLEEPLLKTAKDKMMKLAEAVTDNATAHAETKFVEEAVHQLLKARRVLKCSYVYGYYLDGLGDKKTVFELMQTELEECTEILSQMVNRLYLRTPRRKIIEQAHVVQRKRLEFIMAISKGLLPPETPPSARKGKKKRKYSRGSEDEDLHRAIVASIQEVDPANPWIKDASGRHTNVVALLEWPSDDSEESEGEAEQRARRESIGKCQRAGCNKARVKNPRTNEHHNYCSRWCMLVDKEDQTKEDGEGLSEIVLDEHMELLRALEMSRLQYLRDSGLLHVPETQDSQQPAVTKSTQTRASRPRHRPRSNSAGQEDKATTESLSPGVSAMVELGIELRRFQELSSAFPRGDREEASASTKKSSSKGSRHHRKLSQSSRFDESKSTIVPRVPNKSVEDLYCLDQVPKASKVGQGHSQGLLSEAAGPAGIGLFDSPGATAALPPDSFTGNGLNTPGEKLPGALSSSTVCCDNSSSSSTKSLGLFGSMFGAIKDISISNIHSDESDKTKDFLSKDLASIFAAWDTDESKGGLPAASSLGESQSSTLGAYARRPLTLEDCSGKGISGKSLAGKSHAKSSRGKSRACASGDLSPEDVRRAVDSDICDWEMGQSGGSGEDKTWGWLSDSGQGDSLPGEAVGERVKGRSVGAGAMKTDSLGAEGLENDKSNRDSGEISLLEMAENLLQMTADVHSRMKEVEKGIRGLELSDSVTSSRTGRSLDTSGSERLTKSMTEERSPRLGKEHEKTSKDVEERRWCESFSEKSTAHNEGNSPSEDPSVSREKIFFRLPKTAWSLDTKDTDESSVIKSSASKSIGKTSSQRSKVYDSEGAHSKSSRKVSSHSRKSKKEAVAVALLCDSDVQMHEVPGGQSSKVEKSSHRSTSKVSGRQLSSALGSCPTLDADSVGVATDSVQGGGDLSLRGDGTGTLSGKLSSLESEKSRASPRDEGPGDSEDDIQPENLSSKYFTSAFATLATTAAATLPSSPSATSADSCVDADSDKISYSLTRKIFSDMENLTSTASGSKYSTICDAAEEKEPDDDDSNDIDNVIATSALITDAYETAPSDDNWEDASSVLPSDNQLPAKKDQDDKGDNNDDDDDDVDSVYV